jgi:hypothetical protein
MAKRKNPILPTIKDLEAVVKRVQAQVKKSPQDYYDFNGVDDYELLGSAQKELYEKMLQDYVDSFLDAPDIYEELTDDLPDGRDNYSDYDLDNYVAEIAEESFRDEHGRDPADLDLNSHYDELVAIEPDLKDLIYCQLTVGASGNSKEFGYQTGDNSYTGGAYGYPLWAIVSVDIYSHPKSVAKDIRDQIAELWHGQNY